MPDDTSDEGRGGGDDGGRGDDQLSRLISHGDGTSNWVARPACEAPGDPITPAEAAEELDDREADELAGEDADRKAELAAGAGRTWAELDACVEMERRCDLDFIDAVFAATEKFCRPVEEPDGGTSLRFLKSPHVSDGLGNQIERSLREMHKAVVVVARRYADHA